MPKNIVTVEIKGIPIDIDSKELGYVELADLATRVEKEMLRLQNEEDIIDTLKQALVAALEFAAQAYLKELNEGGKQKEENTRADQLIAKLQKALQAPNK